MRVTQWLAGLEAPAAALTAAYSADPSLLGERRTLIRRVFERFLERFGDREVRLFRAPGRINLRGMHVDTHGGYLNLMTHQREVVIAAAPESTDRMDLANLDPAFEDTAFSLESYSGHPLLRTDWLGFISDRGIRLSRGHWSNYLAGSALSVLRRVPAGRFRGMSAVVGSDIPMGASLSSSAALCTAAVLALSTFNDAPLAGIDLALAARDAEWFTGSRCGISDQAAIVLGGRGAMINVALSSSRPDPAGARRLAFPEDLRVLVINSFTRRSLSGPQLVEYTRNRFSYSMAMHILREELQALGATPSIVSKLHTLADVIDVVRETLGDESRIFDVLRRVPEALSLDEIRARYSLPDIDVLYEQYFGPVPEPDRPTDIALRGPLMFGVAESQRARLFPDILAAGDYARAGRLMSIGHDGDRRLDALGRPFRYDIGDSAIEALRDRGAFIEECPGAYGASAPALDALCDATSAGSALGASLTGAGIAGTVLALCDEETAPRVAESVRNRLAQADYASLAGLDAPLAPEDIAGAVVLNHATAAAGELSLG